MNVSLLSRIIGLLNLREEDLQKPKSLLAELDAELQAIKKAKLALKQRERAYKIKQAQAKLAKASARIAP